MPKPGLYRMTIEIFGRCKSSLVYTAKNSVAHEATQSVAKMLIHTSLTPSATVVWPTREATSDGLMTATLFAAV